MFDDGLGPFIGERLWRFLCFQHCTVWYKWELQLFFLIAIILLQVLC